MGEILLLCLVNVNGHSPVNDFVRRFCFMSEELSRPIGLMMNYEYNTWWYIEKVFDHYKAVPPCWMEHLV